MRLLSTTLYSDPLPRFRRQIPRAEGDVLRTRMHRPRTIEPMVESRVIAQPFPEYTRIVFQRFAPSRCFPLGTTIPTLPRSYVPGGTATLTDELLRAACIFRP